MTEQMVIDIASKGLWVAIKVAAPALLAILVTGLAVSIVQAATQINEQTMSFIPKVLAMTLALIFFGPWIIKLLMEFTIMIISGIPGYIHNSF